MSKRKCRIIDSSRDSVYIRCDDEESKRKLIKKLKKGISDDWTLFTGEGMVIQIAREKYSSEPEITPKINKIIKEISGGK